MHPIRRSVTTIAALCAALLGSAAAAPPSRADSDACREWRVEHREWKVEALQAFLRSRPRASQDETLFEVLQREAYLTSCDPNLRATRAEMVGWRLVGRSADEYPVALTESVLAAGGFDLELRHLGAVGAVEPRAPRPRRARFPVAQRAGDR